MLRWHWKCARKPNTWRKNITRTEAANRIARHNKAATLNVKLEQKLLTLSSANIIGQETRAAIVLADKTRVYIMKTVFGKTTFESFFLKQTSWW